MPAPQPDITIVKMVSFAIAIALMAVTSKAAVAAPPAATYPNIIARGIEDKPTCPSTPAEYWQCISDCLYKVCKTGDAPCISACDNNCG